jgi:hypothetical protein
MTSIISVGCDIANIHREYTGIHKALFGASSFRLVIASMTGRTTKIYRESLRTLEQLQIRLSELSAAISTADAGAAAYQADQLRGPLSEYVDTLDIAIDGLQEMYTQLLKDEDAYCSIPQGGQSVFNQDKIRYERVLLQLEQHGSGLNHLFSRF